MAYDDDDDDDDDDVDDDVDDDDDEHRSLLLALDPRLEDRSRFFLVGGHARRDGGGG